MVVTCVSAARGQTPTTAGPARVSPADRSVTPATVTNELPPLSNPVPQIGARPREISYLTEREFFLSLEVLTFGLVVVAVEYAMLRRRPIRADEALRVYGVTLILIGTLFAVTAGYSAQEISPALGLFGTVAGYLLGRRTSDNTAGNEEDR
jgi:hypothetical protein